jgi:hypothetical protein
MENDSTKAESTPEVATAKTISAGAPPEMTPATNKAFREYEEQLRKVAIPQAHTDMKTAHTAYISKRLSRWKAKCELRKADDALHFYQALSDNIGVFARKDAALIKSKIDTIVGENNKKVTDNLNASFTKLKEAKIKLSEARAKGDELFQKLTDSAYSDAVSELVKCYKDSTPMDKTDTKKNFGEAIERLKRSSVHCFNLADDAVEIVVKIAGIHANSSISLLTPVGADVSGKADALQTDIEANIASAQTKFVNYQKSYNKAMEDLSEAKYKKYANGLIYGGILQVTSQVDSPDCKEWSHEEIAKALQKYANQVENNMKELL